MIRKLEITGVHVDADEKLKRYVHKSVAKFERYIPRRERSVVHVDVKLKEDKRQKDNRCTAEIIIHLPHSHLTAKESTVNLYAAIDIVEAKLLSQLKKHKEKHSDPKFLRHVFNKFRRQNPNELG